MKLILKIVGGVVALLALLLVGLNLLLSADAIRNRVADHVKEQTGRDLKVNGSSTILFLPNPHITLTDVEITDPENRAGADLQVARLAFDVSFGQLLSRKLDAKSVVLERPVLTVRLTPEGGAGQQGSLDRPAIGFAEARPRFALAQAAGGGQAPKHDIVLNDVSVLDGTVRILEGNTERRVEHINANLSLPHVVEPLVAKGDFDWKGLRVGFDVKLSTVADLFADKSARLEFGVNTDTIDADFGGYLATRPAFNFEGDLIAKASSVPSVLAWFRREQASLSAIGDGEVSTHIAWTRGEVALTQTRFNLSHASGQGQAVLSLNTPRPYLRAALAVDNLTLDPFFAGSAATAAPEPASAPAEAAPEEPAETAQQFTEAAPEAAAPADAAPVAPEAPPVPKGAAAFDADANINIHETRLKNFVVGPSALAINFRDGVLNAVLSSVQLYDGQGSGKFTLDARQREPTFDGALTLDNVSMQPLLAAAAGFNLIAGSAHMDLQLKGEGGTVDEITHSLGGGGSLDVDDGSIQGINLTELIGSLGAGRMPDLNQGPGAKTDFSALGGTFTMASGVAETHDLEIKSELLKVKARGTVDLVTGSLDFLTQPEVLAGKGGNNKLAGLSIPIRIEGPFAKPTIRPEIAGAFSSPGAANDTVNQIGEMLQQNLKGKPVGEAIGRFLGSVKIRKGTNEDGAGGPADAAPQAAEPDAQQAEPDGQPAENAQKQDEAAPAQDEEAPADEEESKDPDLDEILR